MNHRLMLFSLLATFLLLFSVSVSNAEDFPAIAGPEDIPAAESGITDFYYDPLTGGVHVSVGENVLVLAVEGSPIALDNRNNESALGTFEQADSSGLGHLSFDSQGFDLAGLPIGVHDLGNVLEPGLDSPDQFAALYRDFNFKSGEPGVPTYFSGVRLFGTPGIAYTGGAVSQPPPVDPPDPPPVDPPNPPVVDPPDPPVVEPRGVPPMFADGVGEASPGQAEAFYDPATGEVFVSIGEGVLVIGLEGAPFILGNRNENTPLGGFEQADASGLGQLSFSGLPTGIFNLGALLPPGASSPEEFAALFDNFVFRSGAPGVPENRSGVQILGPLTPAIPEPGCFCFLSIGFIALASRRRATT
jgi:hypothetical protein